MTDLDGKTITVARQEIGKRMAETAVRPINRKSRWEEAKRKGELIALNSFLDWLVAHDPSRRQG